MNEEFLKAFGTRHGQEFYYLLEVQWPTGTERYSRTPEDTDCLPLLLEINDYYVRGRADGFGEAATLTVRLADPFGHLKTIFLNYDPTDVPANVAIRVTNRDRTEIKTVPIMQGYIKGPFKWEEGTRTFTFTVAYNPVDNTLGYTPSVDDIAQTDEFQFVYGSSWYTPDHLPQIESPYITDQRARNEEILNTDPWPLSFNYCKNITVTPVGKAPKTKVVREVIDTTGGWAFRRWAHDMNNAAKAYNFMEAYNILTGKAEAMPYVDVPAATGKIIIPVEATGALVEGEPQLYELIMGDDLYVFVGTLWRTPEQDFDPTTKSGYIQIDLTEAAPEHLLPRIPNPDYNPNIPVSPENPTLIPDIYEYPVGWDQYEQIPPIANFNLPIYQYLHCIQRVEGSTNDPYDPDAYAGFDRADILYQAVSSFKSASRMAYTDLINEYSSLDVGPNGRPRDEVKFNEMYSDLAPMNLLTPGFQQDGLSGFFLTGYFEFNQPQHPNQPAPRPTLLNQFDYPWIEGCWIEVEIDLEDYAEPLDPSLTDTQLAQRNLSSQQEQAKEYSAYVTAARAYGIGTVGGALPPIPLPATKAYISLRVVSQDGMYCVVENPLNWKFHKIINVFKNPGTIRAKDSPNTMFPSPYQGASPYMRHTIIKSGSEISLFNWNPAKQFVVDAKTGTKVIALKFDTGFGPRAILPGTFTTQDMYPGSIWPGYHPACTMVYLGYNAYIRLRGLTKEDPTLLVDLDSPYRTDEQIALKAVELSNDVAEVPLGLQTVILDTRRSMMYIPGSIPRPATTIVSEPLSIREFITKLLFQNGKVVTGNANLVSSKSMMKPIDGSGIRNIRPETIIEKSINLGMTEAVSTVFDVTFTGNDRIKEPLVFSRKYNSQRYGESETSIELSTYVDIADAYDVLAFWIRFYGNYWKTTSLKVTMEHADIKIHDIVYLDLSAIELHYQEPYEELFPTQPTAPAEPFLPSYLGLVRSVAFNIAEGTIDLEVWHPVVAGSRNQDPLYWDTV